MNQKVNYNEIAKVYDNARQSDLLVIQHMIEA